MVPLRLWEAGRLSRRCERDRKLDSWKSRCQPLQPEHVLCFHEKTDMNFLRYCGAPYTEHLQLSVLPPDWRLNSPRLLSNGVSGAASSLAVSEAGYCGTTMSNPLLRTGPGAVRLRLRNSHLSVMLTVVGLQVQSTVPITSRHSESTTLARGRAFARVAESACGRDSKARWPGRRGAGESRQSAKMQRDGNAQPGDLPARARG